MSALPLRNLAYSSTPNIVGNPVMSVNVQLIYINRTSLRCGFIEPAVTQRPHSVVQDGRELYSSVLIHNFAVHTPVYFRHARYSPHTTTSVALQQHEVFVFRVILKSLLFVKLMIGEQSHTGKLRKVLSHHHAWARACNKYLCACDQTDF